MSSYINILKDRSKFRSAGGRYSSEFNYYDTPGHKYFKIFFHFFNAFDDSGFNPETGQGVFFEKGNGLLAPSWLYTHEYLEENEDYDPNEQSMTSSPRYITKRNVLTDDQLHNLPSAWAYFKMNDEEERAIMLEEFVILLSNISSESPWYFSEILGLDSALDRKSVALENFIIDPNRPKITIKCLQDSVDDRIGTLLDLYRNIVWDWVSKREMLPANLRKFDMSILIFEAPIDDLHVERREGSPTQYWAKNIDPKGTKNRTSFKYVELHNCEIDYNSTKNLYATLNNKDGIAAEYNIDIYFDDCYETRYNEFMSREFGDLLNISRTDGGEGIHNRFIPKYNTVESQHSSYDEWFTESSCVVSANGEFEKDSVKKLMKSNFMVDKYGDAWTTANKKDRTWWQQSLINATNQVVGGAMNYVGQKLKGAILGNLYTFSLSKLGFQLFNAASGDIGGTAAAINQYIKDEKQRDENQLKLSWHHGHLVQDTETEVDELGEMFPKKVIQPTVKRIGNLAEGNTIANNL